VVENGVDVSAFAPREAPAAADGLVVGFLGRLSPEKNPLGFLELAERLHADLPALRFRIAGNGPLEAEVRARVDASPARASIELLGHCPDAAAVLRELDVLVVPSRHDGRPNAVMEASAAGVPVLGAPVGAIPELIEEGRNGHVVAATATDRVRDLLAGWLRDPATLARMRASARAIAVERFGDRRMFDLYEAVFRAHLDESASLPAGRVAAG
jgi:glycosyltransferase involved in cell wall biosynthesis